MVESRYIYSVAEAVRQTGVSEEQMNICIASYRRHFAPRAHSPVKENRLFTAEDLQVIAYIQDAISAGQTPAEIDEKLVAGAIDSFPWFPELPLDLSEIGPTAEERLTAMIGELVSRIEVLERRMEQWESNHPQKQEI